MEVKLIVQNGKQAGKTIPVSAAKFSIGRAEDCQLRVQSNLISRKHCTILTEEGVASVEDCGSTNGTFLNDERITGRHELHSGDRLRVGMLGLEVQLAVSVEAKRKPKVHSVQEAAARTAASTPAAQEELDISGWLATTGGAAGPPRSRTLAHETIADKSLVDTATMPAEAPKPDAEQPDERSIRRRTGRPRASASFTPPPSRRPRAAAPAADDALRQFSPQEIAVSGQRTAVSYQRSAIDVGVSVAVLHLMPRLVRTSHFALRTAAGTQDVATPAISVTGRWFDRQPVSES